MKSSLINHAESLYQVSNVKCNMIKLKERTSSSHTMSWTIKSISPHVVKGGLLGSQVTIESRLL
jgi:hypothetical protein